MNLIYIWCVRPEKICSPYVDNECPDQHLHVHILKKAFYRLHKESKDSIEHADEGRKAFAVRISSNGLAWFAYGARALCLRYVLYAVDLLTFQIVNNFVGTLRLSPGGCRHDNCDD